MDKNTEDMLRNHLEIEYTKRIRSHFVVRDLDVPNPRYIRLGRAHDGGYVMLDDFSGVKNAYSAGISNDVSWDVSLFNHMRGGGGYLHVRSHDRWNTRSA
ncbi:MAG: hypothetical protein IJ668_01145 [Selenomonadaceae bacterium]|nr:hypothetical protein [Selenomonadaceae bacterium]